MKLWVDDERPAPDDSWTVVKDYWEARELIAQKNNWLEVISLDHDLGGKFTGYDLVCAIEQGVFEGRFPKLRQISCHSANPVGKARIEAAIASIETMKNRLDTR